MTMKIIDMTISVNNDTIAYMADSLSWNEGAGMVKFRMPMTAKNDGLKQKWKLNNKNNVVKIVGPTGSWIKRIFIRAKLLKDLESTSGTDGHIEIEFDSNPAKFKGEKISNIDTVTVGPRPQGGYTPKSISCNNNINEQTPPGNE